MGVISSYCLVLAVKTACLILLYYVFSISITYYNKWYTQKYRIPLMMTTVHFIVKFCMAWAIRACCKCSHNTESTILPWSVYITRVAPAAAATALDVACSNWGMEYITVALYTMTKSTAIIFILIFGIIFKLEKLRLSQLLIVFLIAGGLFMFTYKSTGFDTKGFALVFCAAILAGIRVTLAQILIQRESIGLSNPVDVIYHLQPVMIIVSTVVFSGVEGTRFALSRNFLGTSWDDENPGFPSLVLVVGALLAFGLAYFEYLLLSHTSALTLSVAAIFKEVILMASDPFFEGAMYSSVNIVGIVICLLGILVHVLTKAMQVEVDRSLQPSEIRKNWENKRGKNGRKRKSRTGQEPLEMLDLNHAREDDDEDDVVVFSSFRQRAAMPS